MKARQEAQKAEKAEKARKAAEEEKLKAEQKAKSTLDTLAENVEKHRKYAEKLKASVASNTDWSAEKKEAVKQMASISIAMAEQLRLVIDGIQSGDKAAEDAARAKYKELEAKCKAVSAKISDDKTAKAE